MQTALTTIAAFALAIATGFVVAQTAPNPPADAPAPVANTPPPADAAPPPPAANQPTPTTMPATPRSNMMPPAAARPGMRPTQMPPDFATLDRNGVGHVTQKDVTNDAWLNRNFATCDTDHDDQVSRTEYIACTNAPKQP